MSSNVQKVVIIQDASRKLGIVNNVLHGLEVKCGDKVILLGIIQAFRDDSKLHSMFCGTLLRKDFLLLVKKGFDSWIRMLAVNVTNIFRILVQKKKLSCIRVQR